MTDAKATFGATFGEAVEDFFFRPTSAHSLALIRIATGLMIAYIHLVWMLNLPSFVGPDALLNNSTWRALHHGPVPDFKWTYMAQTDSMTFAWCHELFACLLGLLLAIGLATRAVSLLAWLTTLMMTHRMTGMLFGLDQITIMLAMYLCVARPGNVWSLDAWLCNRFSHWFDERSWLRRVLGVPAFGGRELPACWTNTLATRMIQLHLCVVYFFGGIGKLRGESWWDGSAMWYSVAAYEYQSLDMTWTGHLPMLSSMATHLTLFWEVTYFAAIWSRWTRPWTMAIALMVHGGIALFLGMVTFGGMMIVANLAFVSPALCQHWMSVKARASNDHPGGRGGLYRPSV